MPAISFFADERDASILLQWLNLENEIAFIVPERSPNPLYQKWKAVSTLEQLKDGHYSLWHIPAGPLSIPQGVNADQVIADPWQGWIIPQETGSARLYTARVYPAPHPNSHSVPYFGPGHPAEIRLTLWLRYQPYTMNERTTLSTFVSHWIGDRDCLAVSDFQWIGNRYGRAVPQTQRFWRRLKAWFGRETTRLAPFRNQRQSFWVFPSALQKLKGGMAYYARGSDLTEAICTAQETAG
jgi:hypothetical protein